MSNFIPFQGGTGSEDSTYGQSGGYLLPPEQGEILVNGILVETGAIQLAGDAKSTSSRRTHFPIWLGQPDAGFVGEGAAKPLTGAALGQGTLNIKKVASIVVFTDEQIEDMMNGDLNVLVDAGVRQGISKVIDQNAVGLAAGAASNFDSTLTGSVNAGIVLGPDTVSNVDDRLQKAVSAAMGVLEANGYGDPSNMGVLLGFGWQQILRDARRTTGNPLYDGGTYGGQSIDALYGLERAHSTALAQASPTIAVTVGGATGTASVGSTNAPSVYVGAPIIQNDNKTVRGVVTAVNTGTGVLTFSGGGTAATTDIVGSPKAVVVSRPNIHVRVRADVSVATSNEASLPIPTGTPGAEGGGTAVVSLFQNNLTAIRYETRLGLFIHDAARAVVPIWG